MCSIQSQQCQQLVAGHVTLTADFHSHVQAYIRNLAPALTSPRTDPSARGFTRQVAKELGHLIECVKLVNMDCFHAMIEGKMNPALARTVNLDAAFCEKLTVR